MIIKNVIFDWSGTLSDDLTPVYHASMLIFKKLGKKQISLEEYRHEFTLPYMNFWNKYFPKIKKENIDKLFSKFIYEVEKPKLYKGVEKLIEKLHLKKKKMIIISSHPQKKLISEVKSYDFYNFFKEINGSVHNKTEIILEILKRNNFNPSETIYVGDMTHDIDAGKKAGVTTVAVDWGYQLKEKLISKNPDYIVSNIADLNKLLQ